MAVPTLRVNYNPPLVIFGGYSGSGKTTHCIPILRSFGYRVISASSLLHQFSDRLISNILGCKFYDSHNRELEIVADSSIVIKDKAWFGESDVIVSRGKYREKTRQFLVDLAERCLVPVFGRAIFAHAIADAVRSNPRCMYAIELFSEEEYFKLKDCLYTSNALVFNLRRASENPEADTRTLLPGGVDVHNNGTYEDLEFDLRFLMNLSGRS